MELLIVGIATGFNFCILMWKFKKGRFLDFCIDTFCMVCICSLFASGMGSLTIGMIGSAICSLYLLIYPIRLMPLLHSLNPFTTVRR